MVEIWNRKDSGILRKEPLLLRACKADAYGNSMQYDGGAIYQAHFTYLCGIPNRTIYLEKPELFFDKLLICLSPDWERFVREQHTLDQILLRRLMKPLCKATTKVLSALPSGYKLCSFDEDAFNEHPYGHGLVYESYEDFSNRGSGAVVRYGDKIVASASSHLTFGSDVELDVTTNEEHRRKGLADHCVAAMINDCAMRGLTVNWDAKNTPSMKMALSFGFEVQQEYAVYVLKMK